MKFQTTTVGTNSIILANDHYVAVPYNCGTLTALATNDVIPAGTVVPSNDDKAKAFCCRRLIWQKIQTAPSWYMDSFNPASFRLYRMLRLSLH